MTVVTPDTAAPLLSVERNFTCQASAWIVRRNLDGPSIEHLARAERVQVFGLAIEEIVGRSFHANEQPRGQPLIEVQAAEHALRDRPLAPASQVVPGRQDCPLILHDRDASASSIPGVLARVRRGYRTADLCTDLVREVSTNLYFATARTLDLRSSP